MSEVKKFELFAQAQAQLSKVHGVLFDIISEFAIADLTQGKYNRSLTAFS